MISGIDLHTDGYPIQPFGLYERHFWYRYRHNLISSKHRDPSLLSWLTMTPSVHPSSVPATTNLNNRSSDRCGDCQLHPGCFTVYVHQLHLAERCSWPIRSSAPPLSLMSLADRHDEPHSRPSFSTACYNGYVHSSYYVHLLSKSYHEKLSYSAHINITYHIHEVPDRQESG